ncbi:hypothetical protein CCACVL1_26984, partial [Corchorus capsularis]
MAQKQAAADQRAAGEASRYTIVCVEAIDKSRGK